MPPSALRQPARATRSTPVGLATSLLLAALVAGCGRDREGGSSARSRDAVADSLAEAPSPPFRNVGTEVAYVGDSSCVGCHADAARAYHQRSMSRSMHRWTRAVQVESTLVTPIADPRTGFRYAVVEDGGRLWQVEFLAGADGRRTHELRRSMDWVVGSGRVARTYFTEANGRLTQLPLTWYRDHGWDFSPGYELTNLRFDRVLPDRCVACHSSYPVAKPYLEGKYAELRPGIGCERCHGPGALHVAERRRGVAASAAYDATIVNPARLPVERRLDVCEQCHVHADVELPREGRGTFAYVPSQRLSDYYAFYRKTGAIDVVSHADRLRQSACFLATRRSPKPLECATCHDPHDPSQSGTKRDDACLGCHELGALSRKLEKSAEVVNHSRPSDCVSCHMPTIRERTVPHGTFTEHWIRVPGDHDGERAPARDAAPIEAYYARDRSGPESRIYLGMGEVMHATQTNDRRALAAAAATLDAALGRDTTRGDALFLLGIAWEQLGDTARAVDVLQRALKVDPRRPEALRALAQAHLRAGRTSIADSLYRRALAAQPALAWIRAEHADLLQAEGERTRAIAEYRRALAEQPDLAVAWFNLGTALAGAGQPATDPFRRAVALDPSLGEALSQLVRVTVAGDSVMQARPMETPMSSLPVRDASARAVRLIAGGSAGQGIAFSGVPAYGLVQIVRPDGTVMRTLSDGGARSVVWDLRTESGRLAGAGLYRARVVARDRSGRPAPAGMLAFGVVRDD